MRATVLWLILLLLAVTIFALSNTTPVTVMFWQWPIYTGSLALAVVGAGVVGALLTLLPSLLRQSHLGGRIRDLERQLRAHEPAERPASPSSRSGDSPGQSSSGQSSSGRVEDTRRFP